ncbi:hypothetical protein H5410_045929 [Solanum commersonii]|uniref:Uncharacterized protein n=1 Tax=Solanum commersonii TaxID=4109 RepID=A0A9J5XD18_SOLCO|nr:hypothetical protein H5410_045929 [Solanum commersonii]
MHQGGDEDTRIELTVKLKDKLETKDIEDGEIQSEDAMIIDAGVKSEVKMEMVRVDEEDEGATQKQLTINLMESMDYANYNCNGKIWVSIKDRIQVKVMSDSDLMLTLRLLLLVNNNPLIVSIDMPSVMLRKWSNHAMIFIVLGMLIRIHLGCLGVFNVILSEEEKIGGLPIYRNEYEDFAFSVNSCDLVERSIGGRKLEFNGLQKGKNTRFFHILVSGRSKKLPINRIQNMEGEWVEGEDQVAVAAQEYFQKQFTGNYNMEEAPILRYVQKSVTE